MRDIAPGTTLTLRVQTERRHSAEEYGNPGVDVVATPALIGLLEVISLECMRPCFEPGEASVGIAVNVRHLAAAPTGAVIETSAEIVAVEGRTVTCAVQARYGETLLMDGTHTRAVVALDRFLERLPRLS